MVLPSCQPLWGCRFLWLRLELSKRRPYFREFTRKKQLRLFLNQSKVLAFAVILNIRVNLLLLSFFCSAQYPRRPGGGASRSSADATGQHAAGGGCSGAGEGWRGRRCCVCCHQLGRDVTWQLARALRLQKQVEPDSQYLPHWAGEVWAGTVSQQEMRADIACTRLPARQKRNPLTC